MTKPTLDSIVQRLRSEDDRWNAILDLKLHATVEWLPELLPLLKDSEWVVRWCISEILGDLNDRSVVPDLLTCLQDDDPHVVKNVKKALIKFRGSMIPDLVLLYGDKDVRIRRHAHDIVTVLGERILDALFGEVRKHDWVIANRLAHAIYQVGTRDAEHMLVALLDYELVQKNVAVILGLMKSKAAIPYFIRFHENPRIRRVVLQSIKMIGKDVAFPLMIKALAKPAYAEGAESLILRIGPAMFPPLQLAVVREDMPRTAIFKLMIQIGHPQLEERLATLIENHPQLQPFLDQALA